jgi:hypothetical protein
MVFKPGQSGNPKGDNGQKKKLKMIRDLLSPYSPDFVKNLIRLSRSKDETICLAATKDALDRIYGKAAQAVELTGENGIPLKLVIEMNEQK